MDVFNKRNTIMTNLEPRFSYISLNPLKVNHIKVYSKEMSEKS